MASEFIALETTLGELDVVIVGVGPVGLVMGQCAWLKDSGSRPGRKWQR